MLKRLVNYERSTVGLEPVRRRPLGRPVVAAGLADSRSLQPLRSLHIRFTPYLSSTSPSTPSCAISTSRLARPLNLVPSSRSLQRANGAPTFAISRVEVC